MENAVEIIKKVKKLEISTKKLVDGLMSGNYHSVFKGQGIEFSDIREYKPGDDIRAIDWKVTARFDAPYIKEFIEERDLRVYFALDISGSGSFGHTISKKQKALEITASLMFAAIRNNDHVGALLFSDRPELFIPARKSKRHILKVLSRMISYTPNSRRTDIAPAITYLSKVLKRKSIIFLISDFYSAQFEKELAILRRRHDVICLCLRDTREQELPDVGYIELEDEETQEQLLIDTSDEDFRRCYKQIAEEHDKKLKTQMKKNKIDFVDIKTHEEYEAPLRKFFKKRKHARI